MTDSTVVPHSKIEDLLGLFTGVAMASLGLYLIKSTGAVTGGTAGLSLLFSYASGISFSWLFVLVNLPFFALALWKKGPLFTAKSLGCVVALSLVTTIHAEALGLDHLVEVYGVVMGNLLAGVGILILFRHGASLGGFNVFALIVQERTGLSAGYVQMGLDVCVVVASAFVTDLSTVALSALGAVVLNLVLAFNHKPGRYMGL
ncbi:YitT family protein [Dermacoccaceae bacterium W4C1]